MIRKNKPLLIIFGLGFSSGLPFLLLLSTLNAWLSEAGISKTQIGLFSLATLPYALKFLWAPFVDHTKLPIISQLLGQRKSWLLFVQICLMISLICLAHANPEINLTAMAILALLVGFCSATQDIVVEAYRIESLSVKKIGLGASSSVLGYRFGMLCSGAGALYLADFFGQWFFAYACMSLAIFVGILSTLWANEPVIPKELTSGTIQQGIARESLYSFLRKKSWLTILTFIFLYKVGDTVLNAMSMPFLLEIGFTKTEIATVAKTFGISAMMLGVLIGGGCLSRFSLLKNLYLCLIFQLVASSLFVSQSILGHHIGALYFTMGIENLACGMSQVTLMAYLSQLCRQPHTATHYAIFSSFSSFSRIGLTVLSGWLADHFIWSEFYGLVCLGCLPALFLLYFMHLRAYSDHKAGLVSVLVG